MNKVRLGIIGCGPRGISVAVGCAPISDVEIVAACDFYPATLDAMEEALGGKLRRYTKHEDFLADSAIDVVHVAVEPENMARVVVDCLRSGKHVLSDVPMAYSLEEIWDIVVTAETSPGKYMMGEALRFWPFMEKWKAMREAGELGDIVYAEGQYLHGMDKSKFYRHPETNAPLSHEEAQQIPGANKSRMWNMPHPILYLPHTLSPMLRVLGDRVTEVVCMGNTRCHAHDWFAHPDLETALMRTERDTVMRVSAGFTVMQPHKPLTMYHWYNMVGTKGSVETHRSAQDRMKIFQPLAGDNTARDVPEDFAPFVLPDEAKKCGHQGIDYWVFRHFFDCVKKDLPSPMDVYAAAETAAPAILAARSAEQDSVRIRVPDFRPGASRKVGQRPASV